MQGCLKGESPETLRHIHCTTVWLLHKNIFFKLQNFPYQEYSVKRPITHGLLWASPNGAAQAWSLFRELGSAYAQGEQQSRIHLNSSHLGQSKGHRCTKDFVVGKSILHSSIAGPSLNVSITIVLEDKGGDKVRKENPENAGDGRRLNGAG